ncbi:hypothetical protein [Novosphingobium album (ex Liu et al. 2023)]|uniref:Uncharacterized protein n=1 Tax=Novosphingobium album (ex Liu et al. 2023) TaxID=3031130 RepID=A0ABT5WQ63_9SPHN|nr:hypothetical protein [Novosphingobium album (ex Liu et al. 2023)]MDE8651896.1 hypothetical protein [Novosphingobium album (ex Liu et al. 2023)]
MGQTDWMRNPLGRGKAARELEVDEDETRWDDRLRKVAKMKPKPENPE